MAAANPAARGTPTGIVKLVAWLAGGQADWMPGQVNASDDGWSAG